MPSRPGIDGVLAVRRFDRTGSMAEMDRVAQEELDPPALRVHLVSSTGDGIIVQVVEGVSLAEPRALVYAEARGAYQLARVERWPGATVLLALTAWPRAS